MSAPPARFEKRSTVTFRAASAISHVSTMAVPRNVPENYERYLVPSIFAPWALDLIEAAALRPGERVLDIACGTGIVARTAAPTLGGGASVVGLDLSAPMLEAACSAAKAEGVFAEWKEGSAVKLPLADATFDVAFCQQGLQFFPDRPTALREM